MRFFRPQLIAGAIIAATLSGLASAQAYPTIKPVRLVVPFAPGGTTDLLARIVSAKLSSVLGQTVIVDNKAGAGGAIGSAEVAKSVPDGYTLLMSSVSTMVASPAINPSTPYDPLADFAHITDVAATPNVLAVHPSFPNKDYQSFAEQLRSQPNKHSYATAGSGTVGHFLGELYKSSAKVSIAHIPYRGSGPALNDAVSGQVTMIIDNVPSTLPFIQDKRLIPVAVAAPTRLAKLPNVPTFTELGFAQVNRMSFIGVSAPKGTPADIIKALNSAIKTTLADASVRERIEGTGSIVVGNSPAEYTKQIKDELEIYKRAVKEQGLKLD
jgi:tripartite-type tricarboxylate transporter receptor subunit TctC